MNKIITIILLLSFFTFSVQADILEDFTKSINEQNTLSDWVQASSKYIVNRKTKETRTISKEEAVRIVREAYAISMNWNISPRLVLAVMKVESGFRKDARSRENARGLMQVIAKYHKDKFRGRNPYDPTASIEVGTIILRDYLDQFDGNIFKALNGYSGHGGKKYYSKVRKEEMELNSFLESEKLKHDPVMIAGSN